jgi:hypothetical protein
MTLPVIGVPPTCPVTVAVKTTVCPGFAGFGDAVSVVVVGDRFTTCVIGFDLLGPKVESPPYDALML